MKKNVFNLLAERFDNADLDEFKHKGHDYISYARITQSYENGPEYDYSEEIAKFLGKYGYKQVSYTTTGCDEQNYSNSETYIYAKL